MTIERSSSRCSIWLLEGGRLSTLIPIRLTVSRASLKDLSTYEMVEYPTPRKFHSVLPFGENRAVVFGGASYQHITGTHIVASPHVWLFDFERLDWTRMASVAMVRPTYFHAAAMNEVSPARRASAKVHGVYF